MQIRTELWVKKNFLYISEIGVIIGVLHVCGLNV